MLKKDLRTHFLELRKNASDAAIADASLQLANNTLALPIWEHIYFHIFLSSAQKKELDTRPLITLLQGRDKEIVIPKIAADYRLEHFLLTDNTPLKPNNWGIPEPVDGISVTPDKIDVVFIPLLGFDLKGFRVGYGKGFYDRFLAECREDTVKIGLSIFEAVDEISDVEAHDIRMDYCITPERTYSF